ncbi:MAG: LamG-like jellyroll fold domain-containing protein [Flavobacterium sp.]|uniref:LamG-like jellyroll fold domain-containing protein n=1 Tax=Flavobacterium sp. TaxID=239 RepID=UPI0032673F07
MKTRLLLLFALLSSAIGFSQINYSSLNATSITTTTAVVSATVNNACASGSFVNMEYSLSSTFTVLAGTSSQQIVAAFVTEVKSYNLTGLTPNTTYYFRYYSGAGESCNGSAVVSSTQSFTTSVSLSPIISAISSTSITPSTATINYSLNANNSATTSGVEYGLTNSSFPFYVNGFNASGTTDTPGNAILTAGLTANTLYYYRIIANNGFGSTTSAVGSFTTTVGASISLVSTTAITTSSATINYSLNANNLNTTSVVNWGLGSTNLTNQTTGFSASGNTVTPGSATLNGLLPDTLYFYQIRTTNANGDTFSTTLNFRTQVLPGLVSEYKFNSSLLDESNTSSFSAPSVTNHLYTADRFGALNNALVTSSSTLYRDDIINLPNQANPRTISLWIRPTAVNSDNIVLTYGATSGDAVYGCSFNATTTFNFSYNSNLPFTNATTINNWKHIVFTFDGNKVAKIYVNGVLGSQGTYNNWNTSTQNILYLGNSFGSATGAFNGAIDDLKIYNYAITAADVTSLFNNNTLSSQDFNQNDLKVSLYPNPANEVLNIETDLDVKSIEIYNIQGQKVMSSTQKQVNVSALASGMYMVKIKDSENAIATKKFMKE